MEVTLPMSEMIDAKSIADVLKARLDNLAATVDTQEVSRVDEVGDGIAHVSGLKSAMSGELLEFTSSETGKLRCSSVSSISRPTRPVAPRTATLLPLIRRPPRL